MIFPDFKKILPQALFFGVMAFGITYTLGVAPPAHGTVALNSDAAAEPTLEQIKALAPVDAEPPVSTRKKRGSKAKGSTSDSDTPPPSTPVGVPSPAPVTAQPQATLSSVPDPTRTSNRGKLLPADASISLNTSTLDQLTELPGVGPVLAQRILDYKVKIGQYTSLEQLKQVKGFGQKRYLQVVPYIKL